ncbi:hypothetical protein GE09DRAFT_1052755 [Coniochaeta sp. 2T2.1]|nr:hypothetical protein GE09DRAFT_1052755 [Coniochaeta sp. 2T2.1]
MGIDTGFGMVLRLSQDTAVKGKWEGVISMVQTLYSADNDVDFSTSSNPTSGSIHYSVFRFSHSVLVGRELREGGVYDWSKVYDSIRSYSMVRTPPRLPRPSLIIPTDIFSKTDELETQPQRALGTTLLFVIIQQIPGKERGLVARVDILKRARILQAKPLATGSQHFVPGTAGPPCPKIRALSKDQHRQLPLPPHQLLGPSISHPPRPPQVRPLDSTVPVPSAHSHSPELGFSEAPRANMKAMDECYRQIPTPDDRGSRRTGLANAPLPAPTAGREACLGGLEDEELQSGCGMSEAKRRFWGPDIWSFIHDIARLHGGVG